MKSGGALQTKSVRNQISEYELFADEGIFGAKESRPALNRHMAMLSAEYSTTDLSVLNCSEDEARKVDQTLEDIAKSNVIKIQGQYYETYDWPESTSLKNSCHIPKKNGSALKG